MKSKQPRPSRNVSRTLTERELRKTLGGINPQPEPPGDYFNLLGQISQIVIIPQLH